ncbi:MAG: hypothetical protein NZ842_00075 [Dehalococcoidia bacterium]|nr:hypothetical protein [Dehalococcoidia bacterium]
MPDLTLEIRRLPKPGKTFELIEAVTNRFKSSGRRGLVSVALTTPHSGDRDVVSAVGLSSWEELEELNNNVLTNTSIQKEHIDIEDLCIKTPTIQVLNVLQRGDHITSGGTQYMRRNFLYAKRGESAGLVETLLEWRSAMPEGKRPTVQRQTSGDLDLVRVTAGFQSISDMMEASADVGLNPAYSQYREQVKRLTNSAIGFDYKLVHMNTG